MVGGHSLRKQCLCPFSTAEEITKCRLMNLISAREWENSVKLSSLDWYTQFMLNEVFKRFPSSSFDKIGK